MNNNKKNEFKNINPGKKLSNELNHQLKINEENQWQYIDLESVYDIIKEEKITNIFHFLVVNKLTRNKVRSLIGRWFPPTRDQMSIKQVVNDIFFRINNDIEGRVNYYTGKPTSRQKYGRFEYYLIIKWGNAYFFDINREICYIVKKGEQK